MNITNNCVTYNQAVILRNLGFDWECEYWYNEQPVLIRHKERAENSNQYEKSWSAPTIYQVQEWLRKVKGIVIQVFIDDNSDDPWSYEILTTEKDEEGDWIYLVPQWKTNFWSTEPTKALRRAINRALKLLSSKKDIVLESLKLYNQNTTLEQKEKDIDKLEKDCKADITFKEYTNNLTKYKIKKP